MCLTLSLFSQVVLQRSGGLNETGTVVWQLALCLLLSNIIIAAVLVKGIKSSGKVSLFQFNARYTSAQMTLLRQRRSTSLRRDLYLCPICWLQTYVYAKTCSPPLGRLCRSLSHYQPSSTQVRRAGNRCSVLFLTAGHENEMNAPGEIQTLSFQSVAMHQSLFSSTFE